MHRSASREPRAEGVLVHDEIERSYVVHVPPRYDHETLTPLVLAFHGYANSPEQQEEWSGARHEACEAGAEVELCTIEGGGHTWPGGADLRRRAHHAEPGGER